LIRSENCPVVDGDLQAAQERHDPEQAQAAEHQHLEGGGGGAAASALEAEGEEAGRDGTEEDLARPLASPMVADRMPWRA